MSSLESGKAGGVSTQSCNLMRDLDNGHRNSKKVFSIFLVVN